MQVNEATNKALWTAGFLAVGAAAVVGKKGAGPLWDKVILPFGKSIPSGIRHPMTTASNAFSNIRSAFSATYRFSTLTANKIDNVFEQYVAAYTKDQLGLAAKCLKSTARSINKAAPITGRVASKVSRFHAAVYDKVIPYNPMSAIFRKAPSLKNPTYAATAARASLLASAPLTWQFANQKQQYKAEVENVESCRWEDTNLENKAHSNELKRSDAERQLFIELFTMTVGTMLLMPVLAKYFSGHVVTKTEALGWGLLFGGAKYVQSKLTQSDCY